jgi:excisionase family DNA binding protein
LGSIIRLEVTMGVELLRAPEAARRLELPTKEVLRLIYERKIRYVMVKGNAHVPAEAVEEYRAKPA